MSSQITLNKWSGESKEEAAAELSKVFRMDLEKASVVVENLCQDLPWRFNYTISNEQAKKALKYLQNIGFSVDIKSINNGVEPLPEPEFFDKSGTTTRVLPDNEFSHRMGFRGDGQTLFGINFTNLLKTILTFGFYRFWANTNVRQYLYSQTFFAGDRFSYHGTGKELLWGATRFGLIFIFLVIVNIYTYFKFGAKEGELAGNILAIIFSIWIPFLMVGAWRYRLSRTDWRGIRFSFSGQMREAFFIYVKGSLLVPLTLGLFWPFFKMERENFWRGNSWFGDEQMCFSGKGKDFLGKLIVALFLTPLTLGLYFFWFSADLSRYIWSHTHIGESTFYFPIKGRDYFNLKLINFFLIVSTLGLAYPWVVVRNRKFITDHLTLVGNIELNRVVKVMKETRAFGEEGIDIMGVPMDVG